MNAGTAEPAAPNRIRHWREERRLSRRELAERIDTSPGQVQKLENGERKLTQQWMEKLARALEVEPADLLLQRAVDAVVTLKTLRKRAGMGVEDVAKALGMPKEEYAALEEDGKNLRLSADMRRSLADVFAARGVSGQALFTLAGTGGVSGQAEGARALRPRVAKNLAETVMVPELDVKATAGGGGADPQEIGTDAPVVAEWRFPAHFLRQLSPDPSTGLCVITVIGNSMAPLIAPNTKVVVDINDRKPSPPGIFVVWDGFGLVVKNVQPIPFSEPKRVKISSANPAVDPYERVEEEAYIQGRVVGHWTLT